MREGDVKQRAELVRKERSSSLDDEEKRKKEEESVLPRRPIRERE